MEATMGFVCLPEELHYTIMSFLPVEGLLKFSETNKKFQRMSNDGVLWKLLYIDQYIPGAPQTFISQFYPNSFDWKKMFRVRYTIEKKAPPSKKSSKDAKDADKMDIDSPNPKSEKKDPKPKEWKKFLKKGKELARTETDSVSEYTEIVHVEKENYISSYWLLNNELQQNKPIDNRQAGDLFYFWGRSLKDLNPNHLMNLLKEEEFMYNKSLTFFPKDAYSLYSWAINLRYQMESCEISQSFDYYKKSIEKFKEAQTAGYEKKFCTWGRASLKLHYSRRAFVADNYKDCVTYLQKAEKQLAKLRNMCVESDVLTLFAICFNWSCIYSLRSKLSQVFGQNSDSEKFQFQCKEHLQLCAQGNFRDFLTLDLLDLWYFQDFRMPCSANEWFHNIYNNSKPKKLTAAY